MRLRRANENQGVRNTPCIFKVALATHCSLWPASRPGNSCLPRRSTSVRDKRSTSVPRGSRRPPRLRQGPSRSDRLMFIRPHPHEDRQTVFQHAPPRHPLVCRRRRRPPVRGSHCCTIPSHPIASPRLAPPERHISTGTLARCLSRAHPPSHIVHHTQHSSAGQVVLRRWRLSLYTLLWL